MQDRQRSCMEARDLAREHLAALRAKLNEMKALERSMAAFVASCEEACAGGPGPDCVILEDLSRVPESRTKRRAQAQQLDRLPRAIARRRKRPHGGRNRGRKEP